MREEEAALISFSLTQPRYTLGFSSFFFLLFFHHHLFRPCGRVAFELFALLGSFGRACAQVSLEAVCVFVSVSRGYLRVFDLSLFIRQRSVEFVFY